MAGIVCHALDGLHQHPATRRILAAEVRQGVTWHRHFFHRKESWKTTWKLKVILLVFLGAGGVLLTRPFFTQRVAESLVCAETGSPSDALLLENFDPDYLVFERARKLRSAGVAPKVFVPMLGERSDSPSVAEGFIDVMSRISRIGDYEIIPIPEVEPISLNAAREIRNYLVRQQVKSIVVVTPAFRSRRSELVYRSVLGSAGIQVGCVPVFGTTTPASWTDTWHGVQEVAEQFSKLQYYQLYVLPRAKVLPNSQTADSVRK